MRIYVAGPYAARDHLQVLVTTGRIGEGHHPITSRWLWGDHAITPGVVDAAPEQSDEYTKQHVQEDLADIDRADVVLLFTSGWCMENLGLRKDQTGSGGRHVETGYALAKKKLVIVVGSPENIFHRGACVIVPGVEEALTVLSEMVCEECGDDLVAEGLSVCTECLARSEYS